MSTEDRLARLGLLHLENDPEALRDALKNHKNANAGKPNEDVRRRVLEIRRKKGI